MLASLLYSIVRLLVDLLSIRDREQAELQTEVLALWHQLRVLQRQVRRPRWRPGDRMILATTMERLPTRRWSALLPSPETNLRWHRELVGRLRQAPAPIAAGDGPSGRRSDPQVGALEPEVGVPPDPGRATEAGTPVFTRDCSQSDAVASGSASSEAVNSIVGGVHSPARRARPGD